MNTLLHLHIKQKIDISEQELDTFEQLTKNTLLKKNEHFIHSGGRVPYLAFVNSGAMYSYSIDDKGEKHVVQIALEGHWISDPYGFLTGNKAIYNVCALEPTNVTLLSKESFEKACASISGFERFFRLLIQNAYIHSLERISGIYGSSAEERYLQLMQSSPDMMQKVPQHYIASFLGIKPQSLSRIRKAMSDRH